MHEKKKKILKTKLIVTQMPAKHGNMNYLIKVNEIITIKLPKSKLSMITVYYQDSYGTLDMLILLLLRATFLLT